MRTSPGWSETAPVKLPRRWPNSWLSARSRPVVVQLYGQEHRRAAVRADVDGARDELLAGAALAGDQHRQVVALQPLNLLDDARHRGAGRQEARAAAARATDRRPGRRRPRRAVARRAQRESLPRDGGDHPQAPHDRMADRPRRGDERRTAGRRASRPSGSTNSAPRPYGVPVRRRSRHARVPALASQPAAAIDADVAARRARRKTTAQSAAAASSSAAAVSRPSRSGSAAASTIRRTIASSASAGEMTYSPGADRR